MHFFCLWSCHRQSRTTPHLDFCFELMGTSSGVCCGLSLLVMSFHGAETQHSQTSHPVSLLQPQGSHFQPFALATDTRFLFYLESTCKYSLQTHTHTQRNNTHFLFTQFLGNQIISIILITDTYAFLYIENMFKAKIISTPHHCVFRRTFSTHSPGNRSFHPPVVKL